MISSLNFFVKDKNKPGDSRRWKEQVEDERKLPEEMLNEEANAKHRKIVGKHIKESKAVKHTLTV